MTEQVLPQLRTIPLDTVLLPESPLRQLSSRKALTELAKSLKEKGVLVPVIVEEMGEGYRVIAGLRRVLAAREAGLLTVPALVEKQGEEWKAWATFAENVLREDVNAFDEGRYVTLIMAKLKKSQSEVARLLGMSEAWVSERLRIIEWPEDCRTALMQGTIPFSVGKELSRIEDEGARTMYLRQAISSGCSAAQAARWRGEWDQEQKARQSVAERGLLERTGEAEPGVETSCGVCQREVEPGALRVLYLCATCVAAIEDGLRG